MNSRWCAYGGLACGLLIAAGAWAQEQRQTPGQQGNQNQQQENKQQQNKQNTADERQSQQSNQGTQNNSQQKNQQQNDQRAGFRASASARTGIGRVSAIMGANVLLTDGSTLGRVDDVIIAADGSVYLIVNVDNRLLVVPWRAIVMDSGQSLSLAMDRTRLGQAAFVDNEFRRFSDPAFQGRVNTFFNVGDNQGNVRAGATTNQQNADQQDANQQNTLDAQNEAQQRQSSDRQAERRDQLTPAERNQFEGRTLPADRPNVPRSGSNLTPEGAPMPPSGTVRPVGPTGQPTDAVRPRPLTTPDANKGTNSSGGAGKSSPGAGKSGSGSSSSGSSSSGSGSK